jgi:hypothetical protein
VHVLSDFYVEVSSFVLQNDMLHGYVLYGGTGYNAQCSYLNLYVVKRGGPALFGREWLKSIQLDWRTKEETSFSDKRDSCEVIYGKRLTFMLESSTPVCKRHCDELSDGYCISKV